MSDAADAQVKWPRFKLIRYSAPTGIPHGWDAELLAKGVPDGLAYHVEDKLTLLEGSDSGPLVCFGSCGPDERLCLDPRTKQVVCILYGAFKPGDSPPTVVGPAEVVGSSLDHFIALVRAATERFPFDSDLTGKERRGGAPEDEAARDERRFEEWAQAVLDLSETLGRIDPEACATPGGFWFSFVADVGMGLYGTASFIASFLASFLHTTDE